MAFKCLKQFKNSYKTSPNLKKGPVVYLKYWMVYFKVIGHSKDHFLNGTLRVLWKMCQSRKYSEFLLHFKFIKCFSLIPMICNHFVGKTANQRYNDAYDWCGDVCFLRELLQR